MIKRPRAHDPITDWSLRDLLKAIDPTVLAAERAEATLAETRAESTRIIAGADAARNEAIAKLKVARDAAETTYQAGVQQVISDHQAAVQQAKEDVQRAVSDHAVACGELEPLVQELHVRTQRVSAIAARG